MMSRRECNGNTRLFRLLVCCGEAMVYIGGSAAVPTGGDMSQDEGNRRVDEALGYMQWQN